MRHAFVLATMLVTIVGCGDHGSRHQAPTPDELRGSYDVTRLDDGPPSATVGTAGGTGDEIHIFFPTGPGIDATGTLRQSGDVDLHGINTNSDARVPLFGFAYVERRRGVFSIFGSFGEGFFRFDMRRPIDADPRPFAGRFRFAFDASPGACRCATTADVAIDVDGEGFGTMRDTSEVDGTGHVVSTIHSPFEVVISPTGHVAFNARYESPPNEGCQGSLGPHDLCTMLLDGVLPASDTASSTTAHFDLLDGLTLPAGGGDVTITRLE